MGLGSHERAVFGEGKCEQIGQGGLRVLVRSPRSVSCIWGYGHHRNKAPDPRLEGQKHRLEGRNVTTGSTYIISEEFCSERKKWREAGDSSNTRYKKFLECSWEWSAEEIREPTIKHVLNFVIEDEFYYTVVKISTILHSTR